MKLSILVVLVLLAEAAFAQRPQKPTRERGTGHTATSEQTRERPRASAPIEEQIGDRGSRPSTRDRASSNPSSQTGRLTTNSVQASTTNEAMSCVGNNEGIRNNQFIPYPLIKKLFRYNDDVITTRRMNDGRVKVMIPEMIQWCNDLWHVEQINYGEGTDQIQALGFKLNNDKTYQDFLVCLAQVRKNNDGKYPRLLSFAGGDEGQMTKPDAPNNRTFSDLEPPWNQEEMLNQFDNNPVTINYEDFWDEDANFAGPSEVVIAADQIPASTSELYMASVGQGFERMFEGGNFPSGTKKIPSECVYLQSEEITVRSAEGERVRELETELDRMARLSNREEMVTCLGGINASVTSILGRDWSSIGGNDQSNIFSLMDSVRKTNEEIYKNAYKKVLRKLIEQNDLFGSTRGSDRGIVFNDFDDKDNQALRNFITNVLEPAILELEKLTDLLADADEDSVVYRKIQARIKKLADKIADYTSLLGDEFSAVSFSMSNEKHNSQLLTRLRSAGKHDLAELIAKLMSIREYRRLASSRDKSFASIKLKVASLDLKDQTYNDADRLAWDRNQRKNELIGRYTRGEESGLASELYHKAKVASYYGNLSIKRAQNEVAMNYQRAQSYCRFQASRACQNAMYSASQFERWRMGNAQNDYRRFSGDANTLYQRGSFMAQLETQGRAYQAQLNSPWGSGGTGDIYEQLFNPNIYDPFGANQRLTTGYDVTNPWDYNNQGRFPAYNGLENLTTPQMIQRGVYQDPRYTGVIPTQQGYWNQQNPYGAPSTGVPYQSTPLPYQQDSYSMGNFNIP